MVQLLDLWKDFIRPPVFPLEELELAHMLVLEIQTDMEAHHPLLWFGRVQNALPSYGPRGWS